MNKEGWHSLEIEDFFDFLGRRKNMESALSHLSEEEVLRIRGFISKKIEEDTAKHDFKIDENLAEKEELFFVWAIDSRGGIESVKNENWDMCMREMGLLRHKAFEEEIRISFEHFKNLRDQGKGGGGANTRYSVHLELLQADLLRHL